MSHEERGERARGSEVDRAVEATDLVKTFGRRGGGTVHALDQVSLEVERGEFVVLLGPSGCGKTTLLRSVAGLETPDAGSIVTFGRPVFSSSEKIRVPPERRGISLMFQTYALWPHMTAFDNVAYPLRTAKMPRAKLRAHVDTLLERVGIGDLGDQYPSELSGGQQQRVALARTLAREPKLILFDEPLSNVDAKVREQLRVELITMQRAMGFSSVYVTHDQAEAMALADRLVVMDQGRIAQQGTPEEIYRRPTSLYTAEFIGIANRLDGQVTRTDGAGHYTVATAAGELRVAAPDGAAPIATGQEVHLIMRPEDLVLGDGSAHAANSWTMQLLATMFSGSHVEYAVEDDRIGQMIVWSSARAGASPSATEVRVSVEPDMVHIVPAAAPGRPVSQAVAGGAGRPVATRSHEPPASTNGSPRGSAD